ncbi:phosphoglycerate mutase-like protein [Phaeosphaeriaceae sp. SRC1lsM3a]|nr:phosphoglycerate mutase-like protein [Stagonospora sp. SRC1lsM3a]
MHFSSGLLAVVLPSVASTASAFDPLKHLAGIAPYFEEPLLDPKAPQGCNVTNVQMLVRHAAIYGNDFDFEEYIEPLVEKLKNSSVDWRSAGPLDFLAKWQSPIEEEDLEDLTQIGMLESYKLGVDVHLRYPGLKTPSKVWTSTAERTELSASSFINGLAAQSNETKVVSVREDAARGADSLTPYKGCPKYSSSYGSNQSSEYKSVFTKPIVERLQDLTSGFNFTEDDVVGMFQLCGYETVIRGSSPFCSLDLFSQNDWLSFEYMNDIMYFYNAGYGNEISGVLGWPWFSAAANTLMGNGSSQDLYVSFTHRELPPAVMVTLGIFNNSAPAGPEDINATMPLTKPNHYRAWKSSKILPFLTNIAIERMTCDSYGYDAGDYVRVLVNQDPQPLECADGPGESCPSSAFADFVKTRGEMFSGFTEKCSPKYDNSTDTLTIFSS